VRDDAQLRHSKEADWLAGLRRGEPFYEQMLAAKEDDAVIAALFPDLLADDPTVADRAASALYYVRYPLPPNSDAQMAKAVTKQLAAPREDIHLSSTRRELFGYLSLDLAQFKTDAALRAELELAHSPTLDAYALGSGGQDNQTRAGIVKLLAQFPQPEALQQLRGFLGNADGMVRAWAAVALAQKRDPVAFAFLAKTMESPPLENIGDLFEALRWYSPDLRVAAALRRSTKASDARIRQLARKELKVELEKESAAGN
jgi:HEAT repeat protein